MSDSATVENQLNGLNLDDKAQNDIDKVHPHPQHDEGSHT